MRKLLALLLTVALVLSLSGAAMAESTGSTPANTLYISGAPETLFDAMWENFGGLYKNNVFRALFLSNADFTDVEPDLAESVTVSDDNLQFDITLRTDAVWHDGEPFTADDVVFSLKTALRAGIINTIFTSAFRNIEGAVAYAEGETEELTGVTVNDNVVTIKLSAPYGAFLNVLAQFAIYPEHLLAGADPLTIHNNEFWENPVGIGPYKIAEVQWDDYALLQRNEDFYGEMPQIEYIRMGNVSDTIVACMAGELDYFNTDSADILTQVAEIDGYEIYPVDIFYMRYFIFNIEGPDGTVHPMNDVRVRQALMYALDREAIVSALFPTATITDTFVPSGMADYLTEAEHYTYDPEKATALLQEAGFDFNQTIKLRYYYSDQATIDFMDVIASYWNAIGLNVDVSAFSGDATTQIYDVRDWDIVYKGLSAFGYEEAYGELLSSGNIMKNLVQSDVYDELVTQLGQALDPAERSEIVKELQKLDQKYMFRLPLYSLPNCVVVNTNRVNTAESFGNEWYNYDRGFETWTIVE